MISIRTCGFSKLLCVAAVSALPVLAGTPVHAQQFAGFSNTRVATAGDLATGGKLNPRIRALPGLNFSTIGLFGDSEVFGQFSAPRQFIFALPDFSGAGLDFSEMTFDEYLNLVANSYELADSADYLARFTFQNPLSTTGNFLFTDFPDLIAEFNGRRAGEVNRLEAQFGVTDLNELPPQLLSVINAQFQSFESAVIQSLESRAAEVLHEEDFTAGGGFLKFTERPAPTGGDVPLDGPLTPRGDGDTSDTSDDGQLASDIAPIVDSLGGDNGGADIVVPTSASQGQTQAANVSVVPEPATLGLLALGATAMLVRRRR